MRVITKTMRLVEKAHNTMLSFMRSDFTNIDKVLDVVDTLEPVRAQWAETVDKATYLDKQERSELKRRADDLQELIDDLLTYNWRLGEGSALPKSDGAKLEKRLLALYNDVCLN